MIETWEQYFVCDRTKQNKWTIGEEFNKHEMINLIDTEVTKNKFDAKAVNF